MKKKYIRVSSLLSHFCALALPFLGFGCSEGEGGEPCMYGTPTGSFEIKGKVTMEDGSDVRNTVIRVTESEVRSDEFYISEESIDTQGQYCVKSSYFPIDRMKVVCIPDSKELEPDSTIVELKYVKDKNNNNPWYNGHAEATADFIIKKKDSQ